MGDEAAARQLQEPPARSRWKFQEQQLFDAGPLIAAKPTQAELYVRDH